MVFLVRKESFAVAGKSLTHWLGRTRLAFFVQKRTLLMNGIWVKTCYCIFGLSRKRLEANTASVTSDAIRKGGTAVIFEISTSDGTIHLLMNRRCCRYRCQESALEHLPWKIRPTSSASHSAPQGTAQPTPFRHPSGATNAGCSPV